MSHKALDQQMLSVKTGAKIYERLVALCEENVKPSVIIKLSIEEFHLYKYKEQYNERFYNR